LKLYSFGGCSVFFCIQFQKGNKLGKKFVKKIKRSYKQKIKLIERKTMPFDPGFEADMQAVAEKNVYPAGFTVSVEVPPTTPVVVTEKFVAGLPPVVV
jgi:hypothetical protein